MADCAPIVRELDARDESAGQQVIELLHPQYVAAMVRERSGYARHDAGMVEA